METFYRVNRDFFPDDTGLVTGMYLRHDLPITDIMLLQQLLDKDVITVVKEDLNCVLIDEKGFRSEIRFPSFKPAIDIAASGRSNLGHFTIAEGSPSFKDFEGETGRITFVFKEKTKGKNEFIYEQK